MRKNRKNSIRKERIIMIASSAFVLAALTMTGVYMKDRGVESKDDGYTLDFTALENNANDKFQELSPNDKITDNQYADNGKLNSDLNNNVGNQNQGQMQKKVTEDDLDYMPMEQAGSNIIEIPGLTNQAGEPLQEAAISEEEQILEGEIQLEQENTEQAASASKVVVDKQLHFAQEDGLICPVSGDILMHYSMDSSIYFATLDQYKYNPAVMIAAEEGTIVQACAQGKVVDIFEDAEIGKAVTLELGDGYQATYGQLQEIKVSENGYVDAGEALGVVAAPTIYYSVEGSNVYFKLTKDGTPVNPEGLFR